MRIFLTLHPSANLSVPGSMTWYHNFYEPLIDLGHDVFLLRIDESVKKFSVPFRSKKFNSLFSEELVNTFSKEHLRKPFDLFLSYLTDMDVSTDALKLLKKHNVPMLNFSCNNTHQFYLVKEISPYFDFSLHAEKDVSGKFREIGANPIWFPMAANPNYYHPSDTGFRYDVSFIGAAYAKRSYYVWHLLSGGINISCFGPNWKINNPNSGLKTIYKETKRAINHFKSVFTNDASKRYFLSSDINYYDLQSLIRKKFPDNLHYPVSDVEAILIYNSSFINLGFLEVNSRANDHSQTLKQHLHLREFEVPMSRGLYITNYTDELTEFYEPDEEILVFHNEHDLTDKIKYYLQNEKKADEVRERGFRRALNCHTSQKRFADLFEKNKFTR